MLIRFWGTRGSIPAPLNYRAVRSKIRDALIAAGGRRFASAEAADAFIEKELPFALGGTFGGNTSCVELVTGGDDYVLCDAGSGLREFGNSVIAKHGTGKHHRFHIFLSHVHWDHINGFPFFTPSFIPGNVIRVYGCHKIVREALIRQQSAPCFPVDFRSLASTIEFVELEPGKPHEVAGITVRPFLQNHPNDSYGYRFTREGKSVVYSTDSEHKYQTLGDDYPFVTHFRHADVLIIDAQYSLADQISVKEDWGHSSNIVAVELAQLAKAKHLVMYHHEPMCDDRTLERTLDETRRYAELSGGPKLKITSAYDGLELEV